MEDSRLRGGATSISEVSLRNRYRRQRARSTRYMYLNVLGTSLKLSLLLLSERYCWPKWQMSCSWHDLFASLPTPSTLYTTTKKERQKTSITRLPTITTRRPSSFISDTYQLLPVFLSSLIDTSHFATTTPQRHHAFFKSILLRLSTFDSRTWRNHADLRQATLWRK